MKQLRPFMIALFIIVWLVACVRGDEAVGETAVPLTRSHPTYPHFPVELAGMAAAGAP